MSAFRTTLFALLALFATAGHAADVKISALPAGSALGGTEAIPAVQSAATVKITPAQFATYYSALTATMTGKTIDGDTNTVQDLPVTAIKTVGGSPLTFISRDGSGIPISTKAVPTGVVVGESDTQTLTNKTLGTNTAATVAITFSDNVRQTFNPGANAAGLNVGLVSTTDPDTLSDGDLWYNDNEDSFKLRTGGATTVILNSTSAIPVAQLSGQVALAKGGTAANLTDPNADRILFWDDSAGAVTWLTAGTGLTITTTTITSAPVGFTPAENTASPNNTVNVDSLTANSATTNAGAALIPKAAGPVLCDIPDSDTTGGNVRGANAVDWQCKDRNVATEVASGAASVIGGGATNTASGAQSVVDGGVSNTASGAQSTVGGGESNAASGAHSTVPGGTGNVASGVYSIATGATANTLDVQGAWAHSSHFATLNTVQSLYLITQAQTSGNTPTAATTDGGAASATNTLVIPSGATASCYSLIVARSGANSAGFDLRGLVENNGGTTALLGAAACVAIGTPDAALSTAACAMVADNTNDSAVVQVTGVVATDIHWTISTLCPQGF